MLREEGVEVVMPPGLDLGNGEVQLGINEETGRVNLRVYGWFP